MAPTLPCVDLFVAHAGDCDICVYWGLVWDYTSGSFRQARGWELRMWLCDAIHCTLYFSLVLFTRQMLLCDMAYIEEYAEGDVLTVYMLRREIDEPSDYDKLQVETALRFSDWVGLWAVASRGVHMRFPST